MDNFERKKRYGSLYCLDSKLNIHKIDEDYGFLEEPKYPNSFFYDIFLYQVFSLMMVYIMNTIYFLLLSPENIESHRSVY